MLAGAGRRTLFRMGATTTEVRQLRRLLDVTRQMAATTDLSKLLETIVDAACAVLDCERATVFLYNPAAEQLCSRAATGAADICFPADRGIAGVAAQKRVVVNVPDAYADARFNRDVDRQTGFVTRNLLTLPLENIGGELMGVLQALNKHDGAFGPDDEELALILGAQAGVALHRQNLLEQYAHKQRMQHDLELARRIQQELFPKDDPQVPGYTIAGWNCCADETGGDCYDFMPLEDGRLAIVLADATGHGIGAALVIAQCRSLLRALLSVSRDVHTAAHEVNALLCDDIPEGRFVTAFVGVLDPKHHRVEYVAAGQGPLLLFRGADVTQRAAGALPFAIDRDLAGVREEFTFEPGDRLVLLTDGFYEAANAAGEQFGETRVRQLVQGCTERTPAELITALAAAVTNFTGGRAPADDLTAVVVQRV